MSKNMASMDSINVLLLISHRHPCFLFSLSSTFLSLIRVLGMQRGGKINFRICKSLIEKFP